MKPLLPLFRNRGATGLWLSLALLAPRLVSSQALFPAQYEFQPYTWQSGAHDNPGDAARVAAATVIQARDAKFMRVHFQDWQLGRGSFLVLVSLRDGGRQQLDAGSLRNWQSTSAFFNGDSVAVELHVAPGDEGVFASVDFLITGCGCDGGARPAGLSDPLPTLCGSDNRTRTTDNRVGRINGCTAWLVSNGAVLTAGHCGFFNGVFEVNVPTSQSDGTPVMAAPIDQYPIDPNGQVAVNAGVGNDWAVFRLLPNTMNGQTAHAQHGFFRMTKQLPTLEASLRVTGYGLDNSPQGPTDTCCSQDSAGNCTHRRCNSNNRTCQTSTGPFRGAFSTAGNVTWLTYRVDTEPANSGSPIIRTDSGFTIGIHTTGGCLENDPFGVSVNQGTSFENDDLERSLQDFFGGNTRYVDVVRPPGESEDGTIFRPFGSLSEAVSSVPAGGRIALVRGEYTWSAGGNTLTINKAVRLIAPVGPVTIGR